MKLPQRYLSFRQVPLFFMQIFCLLSILYLVYRKFVFSNFEPYLVVLIYKIKPQNHIYKYYICHFNRVCTVLENFSVNLPCLNLQKKGDIMHVHL